jgi:RNA recognition motif-containing protein
MNIYVGNLSFRTDDQELNEVFSEFGDVASAKVVIDRETDRSRGFGFVEMDNDDEAKAAIAALDGAEVSGRNLRVNEAKPRESRF